MTAVADTDSAQLDVLLRGEAESVRAWLGRNSTRRLALCVGVILIGSGLYGAAMGCWRAPLQAVFVMRSSTIESKLRIT